IAVFGEMRRRVDVSSAVLGSGELVGAVVIALLGQTVVLGLEHEPALGRPENGLCVVGVAEIDDRALRQGPGGAGGTCGRRVEDHEGDDGGEPQHGRPPASRWARIASATRWHTLSPVIAPRQEMTAGAPERST